MPLQVHILREWEELLRLQPRWRELQEVCPSTTIFQTDTWLFSWLQHWQKGILISFLILKEGPQVVGIAPFLLRRTLFSSLRRLELAGGRQSDYLGILVAPGYEEIFAERIGSWLFQKSYPFDWADFQQIPTGSQTEQILDLLRLVDSYSWEKREQTVCPILSLPKTREQLVQQWGKKLRGNLRYYRNLLEKRFSLTFRIATEGTLEQDLSAFFDLHRRRWRAKWQPGVLPSHLQRFHRQVVRRLLEDGSLRLHLLLLGNQPVAALYCFRYREVTYYYLGGFHPDFARYSVGTLLTGYAIESALEEGCTAFDFLRGREAYKYRWGAQDRRNWRYLYVPPSWRGYVGKCLSRGEQRIAEEWERRRHSKE